MPFFQASEEVDISQSEEEEISAREAALQAREREAKARELSNLRREEDIAQGRKLGIFSKESRAESIRRPRALGAETFGF